MKLGIIAQDKFDVVCASKDKEGKAIYPAYNELEELSSIRYANVAGLMETFDTYAKLGWSGISSKLHHEVDKGHCIYEFIKGPIRVFYFEDDNGLVVLCCTDVKKTNKVNKKQLKKAIRLKKDFLIAKGQDLLEKMEL